jgi:hypothetical protein
MSIPNIFNPLPIQEFITPADEEISDSEGDILSHVIEAYSKDQEDQKNDEDQDDVEILAISTSEAIKALECLKLYELQQDQGQKSNILALERLERSISERRVQSTKQMTLDNYFY